MEIFIESNIGQRIECTGILVWCSRVDSRVQKYTNHSQKIRVSNVAIECGAHARQVERSPLGREVARGVCAVERVVVRFRLADLAVVERLAGAALGVAFLAFVGIARCDYWCYRRRTARTPPPCGSQCAGWPQGCSGAAAPATRLSAPQKEERLFRCHTIGFRGAHVLRKTGLLLLLLRWG